MIRLFWSGLLLSASPLLLAQSPAASAPQALSLSAPQQAALGVRTSAVERASANQLLASATVTVPPGQEVTVAAPMAGVIARLDAGLGDSLRAGAALAQFSSPQLADALRQLREAELEARNTQAALERDQAMHAEGIIPTARLQLTHNRQRAAEAAWQAQQAALRASGLTTSTRDYASGQIVAPRAGSVVDVQASVGQRVEAGAVLFRIADLRQLQLDITLSGDKAARLRVGDVVSVPSHGARATLVGIGRSLDASQQARARARVTVPGRLQVGEALQVQLQPQLNPATASAPAWQVPARALLHLQGQTWVLVATPQGFAPTAVQVLSANDELATVQGPLTAEQRVASGGLAALRPMLFKEP
jgi:RND family efflux transporter MFP subunit